MLFCSYIPSAGNLSPPQFALFHQLRQTGSDAGASLEGCQRLVQNAIDGPPTSVSREELHHLVSEAVDVADRSVGSVNLKPRQYYENRNIRKRMHEKECHEWGGRDLTQSQWATPTRTRDDWYEQESRTDPWASDHPPGPASSYADCSSTYPWRTHAISASTDPQVVCGAYERAHSILVIKR